MPYQDNGPHPLLPLEGFRRAKKNVTITGSTKRSCMDRASDFSDEPFDVLPAIAREAAMEIRQNTGAPDSVILAAILTVMTAICQSRIRVKKPTGGKATHVSLYILTAAPTGIGKTPATDACYALFRELDRIEMAREKELKADYESDLETWRTGRNSLQKRFRQLFEKEGPDARLTVEANILIQEHGRKKPKKPKIRQILTGDILMPSIMEALDGEGESMVVVSGECDTFFAGLLKKEQASLKELWDYGTVQRKRYYHAHTATNSNLTLSLTTQPWILRDAIKDFGKNAVKGGFFPRFLIDGVMSDYALPPKPVINPSSIKVDAFLDYVNEFVKERAELVAEGDFDWITHDFDEDAKQLYDKILIENTDRMSSGGVWAGIKEFVLKEPENIVRVAATLHFFGRKPGTSITAETLRKATHMVDGYLHFAKCIFADEQTERDVEKLKKLLHRMFFIRATHHRYLPKHLHDCNNVPQRLVETYGHYEASVLEPLLAILQASDTIRIDLAANGAIHIALNRKVFEMM